MKRLVLLLNSAILLFGQHEANFTIRIEPRVVLQTGTDIPVDVFVMDDLHKPLAQAKVTLQIETSEHKDVKVFPAREVSAGQYIAKPVFPKAGEWIVYVEVHRNNDMSARTTQFNVPD